MKITILTLFPEFFDSFLRVSILKRALNNKKIEINIINIRDYSKNKYKKVDMPPVSGGGGMIMQCQPIFDILETISSDSYKILLSPCGKKFNQKEARFLSKKKDITIICGHYEGIDARINKYVNKIISIGDFILTGGEPAAVVIIDSITRLIDGVIKKTSLINESFNDGLLEYRQYTKPYDFNGQKIPKILYSGDQKAIKLYQRKDQLKITKKYRLDLLKKAKLTSSDLKLLQEIESRKKPDWEKNAEKKIKYFNYVNKNKKTK